MRVRPRLQKTMHARDGWLMGSTYSLVSMPRRLHAQRRAGAGRAPWRGRLVHQRRLRCHVAAHDCAARSARRARALPSGAADAGAAQRQPLGAASTA